MSQVSDSRNAPIVFESGFLSVDARQVRLGNLFSDISAKAGIAIINRDSSLDDTKIDLNISAMTVERTIQRALELAGGTGSALTYQSGGGKGRVGTWIVNRDSGVSGVGSKKEIAITNQAAGNTGSALATNLTPVEREPFFDARKATFVEVVKNEVLVRIKSGNDASAIERIAAGSGANVVRKSRSLNASVRLRIPVGTSVQEFIKTYKRTTQDVVVEPNFIVRSQADIAVPPNDPRYNEQWGLRAIKAEQAWSTTRGAADIVVAVLDSGVDLSHEDLRNKLVSGANIVTGSAVPLDDHGHGSHVAGIIGAQSNNGVGVAGVSWGSMLLPVKVLDANGEGTYADLIDGIIFAVDNGARILNMSLGGDSYSQALADAVAYAHSKGAVLVAAAGNDGANALIYPAAYPEVIGVSATDSSNRIWPQSNRGGHIKIAAPGTEIYSTFPRASYSTASGTSASAAFVSGVAALILSRNPNFTNTQVEQTLYRSAQDLGAIGFDQIYGHGLVDAAKALRTTDLEIHDVSVVRVALEQDKVKVGQPFRIVATIGNQGTVSENNLIIRLTVDGQPLGDPRLINVLGVGQTAPLVWDWIAPNPEVVRVTFAVTVEAVAGETSIGDNTRTLQRGLRTESAGVVALYEYNPPVHSWIAFQAYKLWATPTNDPDGTFAAYLSPWGADEIQIMNNMFNDPDRVLPSWDCTYPCPVAMNFGTSVLQGTVEEDTDSQSKSPFNHFWNPDGGFNDGLLVGYDSAPAKALTNWKKAMVAYGSSDRLTKQTAFYWLGRVAHLLADMSVPAHAHLDPHIAGLVAWKNDDSTYEKFTAFRFDETQSPKKKQYQACEGCTSENKTIPDVDALPLTLGTLNAWPPVPAPSASEAKLVRLFYNLAQQAQYFDSDGEPYNGNDVNGSFQFNLTKKAGKTRRIGSLVMNAPSFVPGSSTVYWRRTFVANKALTRCVGPESDPAPLGSECDYWESAWRGRILLSQAVYAGASSFANTLDTFDVGYQTTPNGATATENAATISEWGDITDYETLIAQNHLQAKAIEYTAALYKLFWDSTHWKVTPSAVGVGSIYPSTPIYRENSQSRTLGFTVTPHSGYVATMSGTCPGSFDGTYFQTAMISSDCTVIATFSPIPSTVPGTPTNVSAVSGNGQAIVTFVAPVNNGGSVISGYTANCGGQSATKGAVYGVATPITVTGLANGTPVTCTVKATNAVGASAASSASNSVTPSASTTVPSAPVIGTAGAGNGLATISFSPPVSNGGSAVTSYMVTSTPGSFTASGAASPIVITGLANGTAYAFTVKATNAIGASAASAASNTVTPAASLSVPGVPTNVTAIAGNGLAIISANPPTSNGGSAITSYTVTSSPGNFSGTGAGSTLGVTGLTNGTAYTFTMRATNAVGTSAASTASNSVTPSASTAATAPSAPTSITATAGNALALIYFNSPTSNGGSTITSYTVISTPGNIAVSGVGSPLAVTGLTNGTAYTFTVRANNAIGVGAASTASNSVIPAAPTTVPSAPTMGSATAGNSLATIYFSPSTSSGGSAISGYVVTSTPGGITASGSTSPVTVNGLSNGTAYTFTVKAANAVGSSTSSAASNSVTPGPTTHTVTPSANNGSISPNTPQVVAQGATASFTFIPPANGIISSYSTSCGGAGTLVSDTPPADPSVYSYTTSTYTTSAVTTNCSVSVSFTYYLTLRKAGTGSGGIVATGTGPSGTARSFDCMSSYTECLTPQFAHGSSVTLNASPAAGTSFVGWSGACTGVGTCTVTMNSPVTAIANFAAAAFIVTPISGANGTVSPSAPQLVSPGSNPALTFTPNQGYYLSSISATCYGGSLAGNTFTINGIASDCTVTAGFSPGSSPTPPSAPTIGAAIAGNGQARVYFTLPSSNGGSAITSYTASCGAFTSGGAASPITVTGLTNGAPVTCKVNATNAYGNSPDSAPSNGVTPATVPTAPTIGTAIAGNAQATVTFLPPASNGGSPITSYSVTCGAVSATGVASPITVIGLTNGVPVSCTVIASNSMGSGPASASSNTVTPVATVPSAPVIGTATGGNAQATVTFSAPSSNGGSPIISYTATCGVVSITGSASPITVTGLTNGSTVTCTVKATNAIGTGPVSATSNSVTPSAIVVPGAPVMGTATGGNAQATVSFTAPTSDGGSAIINYTATCGTQSATGTTSPITVTGLINGVAVTCTVKATNTAGSSVASAASNSVTPATVPSAPTIGAATSGNAQATVNFTAPTSNGGSAIINYTVTCGTQSATGTTSPITVTALSNGLAVTCTVKATNSVGSGVASAASNSVTPATVPGVPTIGTAAAGNAQATVSFTAPASSGGSAIINYGVACGTQSATGTTSPITVTGLTNGVAVTCTVKATNSVGSGIASAASNSVTPATVPGAPTIGTATAGNAEATVSFTAHASNGGSAIINYTATCGIQSATGTNSPITVTGLTNGVAVTCMVKATNAVGSSVASAASNSVTPVTVPGVPTIGVATAGNAQATVSFTAPASNGGSAIINYTATCGTQTATGAASPLTVSALPNGVAVTCVVAATNVVGVGTNSAASNSVTPAALVCSLDFDGDGAVSPTDSLLFERWLLGFRGDALVSGITPSPVGTSVSTFAAAVAGRMALGLAHDFDDNGRVDATTDGLLLSRMAQGLVGTAVTNGALGTGATRNTHELIRLHMNTTCGASFASAVTPLAPSLMIDTDQASLTALGAVYPAATAYSFITGNGGRGAVKLNGIANPGSIRIPNRTEKQFTDATTFDFWARIDGNTGMNGNAQTVTGAWSMALVAKSHDSGSVSISAYGQDTNFPGTGVGYAAWATSVAGWGTGPCTLVTRNPGVPIGTWFRVTAVASTTTGTRMYTNKQLTFTCPSTVPNFLGMNSQDLHLGRYGSGGWYPLDGAIQDIRIYKQALTDAEVQALP